ncbi:hypothetical protein ACSSS7_003805 [Eimeria intestinalis]
MALIHRGAVWASPKPQRLLSVFMLSSLCASAGLPGIQAAVTLDEVAPAPVPTLSYYFNGETETEKTEDVYRDVPLVYDATQIEQLQQQVQQLQQQVKQQQHQQAKLVGKQRRRQRKQQSASKHPSGKGAAADVFQEQQQQQREERMTVVPTDELNQDNVPVIVVGGVKRTPTLRGHGFFLLGLMMLIFCLNAMRSDPAAKGLSFVEGVRLNANSLLKMEDVLRSLFVVLTAFTAPILLAVGMARLARTLPSYIRWAKDHDELNLSRLAIVFLYLCLFLLSPWGKLRQG